MTISTNAIQTFIINSKAPIIHAVLFVNGKIDMQTREQNYITLQINIKYFFLDLPMCMLSTTRPYTILKLYGIFAKTNIFYVSLGSTFKFFANKAYIARAMVALIPRLKYYVHRSI